MNRQEDFIQMAKTLAQLHIECERIGHRVTDANLPLKMYGKNCEVGLKLNGDNGDYWVEVRPSIEQDEQLAIIMQMFGAGNDTSIAIAVANQIKQGTVDKVCDILNHYCNRTGVHPSRRVDIINHIRKEMEE